MILTKWPKPGQGKRRLGRDIGLARAALLARAFLADTLTLVARSTPDHLVIAYAPRLSKERFAAAAPGAVLVPQPRGAFGARLERALAAGLALGDRVVLIGSDSPTLSPLTVRAAFARLDQADCVIGPSEDGGYYLIGCRRPLPETLFSAIPWSTPAVLATTLARARDARLRVARLRRSYDVDDATGLQRLLGDRTGLSRSAATRSALQSFGWTA
ncbi:MAG: TIGR04282 family arsenosugar biosynthesis glycosyltransferase [Chloroflexota bacterium]|nr:TIGR04282 family arsenosugar biosynthesis glycosyltransferase [Chloroflexota bacterium]